MGRELRAVATRSSSRRSSSTRPDLATDVVHRADDQERRTARGRAACTGRPARTSARRRMSREDQLAAGRHRDVHATDGDHRHAHVQRGPRERDQADRAADADVDPRWAATTSGACISVATPIATTRAKNRIDQRLHRLTVNAGTGGDLRSLDVLRAGLPAARSVGNYVQEGLLFRIPNTNCVVHLGTTFSATAQVSQVQATAQGLEGRGWRPSAVAARNRVHLGVLFEVASAARVRTASNSTTAAAAAAFSDSMPPGIGIVTRVSAAASKRALNARALVADRDRQRPCAVASHRDRRPPRATVAATCPPCARNAPPMPRRSTSSTIVVRKCAPCAGAQHLGRPRERAVLRQQHLVDAGRRRRAQDRADVARVLQVVEQQMETSRVAALRMPASAPPPVRR